MRRTSIAVAGFFLLAAHAGCGIFGPAYDDFVIQIDSVGGPTSVPANAPFDQFFFGFVGPDGCYSFKAFVVARGPAGADVTVMGHELKGALCTQALVYLSGKPLTFSPPLTDPFTLRVHQRDGTVLTRVVRVQ